MKNHNEIIWTLTRDLPACSAMPQPNAPHRTPNTLCYVNTFLLLKFITKLQFLKRQIAHTSSFKVMKVLKSLAEAVLRD